MDIFLLIFLIIVLWGVKPSRYNEDYIGRESTTAIKGIFAILILFAHSIQYLPPLVANYSYLSSCRVSFNISNFMGQLIVVMFLLYSGYGVMESFKGKRGTYIQSFFRKRVLKVLIHFDIAVLLFVLLALTLGHEYSWNSYAWSWLGWTSVGNSNWFVFDIIILYMLSYTGLLVVDYKGWNEKIFLWIIFALSIGLLLFLFKNKQLWWYDTILAYPVGMLWSVYRNRIEMFCLKSQSYWTFLAVTFACFAISLWCGRNFKAAFLFIASPMFGVLILLLTMKLKIGNAVLNWLGVNAFAIYILQRLAMIVACELNLNESPFVFMTVVVPATLMIASVFTGFTNRLDRKFFV